ncbi:MAG: phosphodiester glycosidase family protein [Candidatus Kerfeldbacteria bacterium]|nr:phosphodiester glycosidase family protein [Candidatus Kerfeldbacteria bacterium]
MSRRWKITIFILGFLWCIRPAPTHATTLAQRLSGYILIQVEKNGEAWYVYPKTLTRYYLGRPDDAFSIMKHLGLGITNADLAKIPVAGSSDQGDLALRQRLSGYILIQVQRNGEAWYVYPKTLQRYYLGRPTDAFTIMKSLGLGITNANIAQIPPDVGIVQDQKTVVTGSGSFVVDMLTFDRKDPVLQITTDTGQNTDCTNNCTVMSLGSYIGRRLGTAGIHGTYFCPAEYASCAGQTNSFLFPVYNSFTQVVINDDRIKYTTQPMVAFDTVNRPYYFSQAELFVSKASFEATYGVKLQAAISNGPAMVEAKANILDTSILDTKQATVKSYRGALGWKGDTIYLMVVHAATVTDSAGVMTALGLDYAINLDGGGSTALYNAGHYILGPGRNLPNVIVLRLR